MISMLDNTGDRANKANIDNIHNIVEAQRAYFATGATRSKAFRIDALKKLQRAIRENEPMLAEAMKRDLNKAHMEGYMCETGLVLEELSYHIKHAGKWMKERRVHTPLSQFYAKSFISPEPYGVALIVGPWNYPVQLCLNPLIGAISAGNCAVIKPSAYASNVSHAIARLIGDTFPREYIAVIEGGRAENQALFTERFDYIFFTGSVEVGKDVMRAAAEHLTPVTLELGGKSPVIVDKDADIAMAARRIAFGKALNAGQTCVEPDYLFIHKSVKASFIEAYRQALDSFFPNGDMRDMATIISDKHYSRARSLMNEGDIVVGGSYDDERRFIAPALIDIDAIGPDAAIMQQEVFAPILPMMSFEAIDQVIAFITSRPKPLAFYLFTSSRATEKRFLSSCSFGGGCINDTIIHLASSALPFGGVGESGMGSYHGKRSFDTFTHERSIVKKSTKVDLDMRYFPYSRRKLNIIKLFMK